MPNGFLSASPTTRHGSGWWTLGGADIIYAQKHVCPGSGSIEISEIGTWQSRDDGVSAKTRFGIFGHDGSNDCPSTIISNSESAEIVPQIGNGSTMYQDKHTYSTKPQLTGGVTYWLAEETDIPSGYMNVSRIDTGGNSLWKSGTYPAWPTDIGWHTHTDAVSDSGLYAVYQAVAARFGRHGLDGGMQMLSGGHQ